MARPLCHERLRNKMKEPRQVGEVGALSQKTSLCLMPYSSINALLSLERLVIERCPILGINVWTPVTADQNLTKIEGPCDSAIRCIF